MTRSAIAILIAILVSWPTPAGHASEPRRQTVVLQRPEAGAQIMARGIAGRISVEAHDQPTVELELAGPDAPPIADVLRVAERGNRIEIQGSPGVDDRALDLRLKVPRRASLRLRAVASEPVSVAGVSGQLEISNRLGDIVVRGAVGSVVAESQEGDIQVELLAISQELPTALSTFHGNVELRLPEDVGAELSLRSKRGTIRNDFPTETVTDPRRAADPRIVRGTVGEGGVLISVKTYTGNIVVRAARSP